ncbi:MAG: ferredoxin--NADP+ reductase [Polyangiales bacterium]|jgi:ferredoxin--NADP+ reductase
MEDVIIAVVGGAVAGSEAAALAVAAGAKVVVIERNARPYGKIEEGLPRWHGKLREQEYKRINANLDREGIRFVPLTGIGEDISFEGLRRTGFTAVVLATGAWRDRRLPLDGIDEFLGKGFEYQNPFVQRFNRNEPASIPEGGLVVGGGLASIDVVKIMSLETHAAALRQLGHDVDSETLEHKGIPAWCEKAGVEIPNVRRPTLVYRRRVRDMSLSPLEANADEATREKAARARQKILDRVVSRYLIQVETLASPTRTIAEGGRLAGLVFQRNTIENGRVVGTDDEFEIRSELTVSSIGSLPETIDGIPMKGDLYDFIDEETGALRDRAGVFGLGNTLTGRGNIRHSRKNASEVGERLIRDMSSDDFHSAVRAAAQATVESALKYPAASNAASVDAFVAERWNATGYEDYESWAAAHPPS